MDSGTSYIVSSESADDAWSTESEDDAQSAESAVNGILGIACLLELLFNPTIGPLELTHLTATAHNNKQKPINIA